MKKEKKELPTRLSLEDFKMKKLEGKNDIDDLLGGMEMAAADCHQITVKGLDWVLNQAQFD